MRFLVRTLAFVVFTAVMVLQKLNVSSPNSSESNSSGTPTKVRKISDLKAVNDMAAMAAEISSVIIIRQNCSRGAVSFGEIRGIQDELTRI